MIFLTILIIPLIVSFIFFIISKEITIKELGIQILIVLFITGISVLIISCENTTFTEVWNGYIIKKWNQKVSCRHSYQCNCITICSGFGKNRSCTRVCQTCYEHSYDIDWNLKDNTNTVWSISTKDRQGLMMPVFWNNAELNDPTSHLHRYDNYIKAAPGTLFKKQGLVEKYKNKLPIYPIKIYNLYNLNRFITIDTKILDLKKWNKKLSIINSRIGKTKQCNAIVVIVKNQPRDYADALEQYWIGGNKNDAILVVSIDDNKNIIWTNSIALVQNSIFKVELRDSIEKIKILDINILLNIFEKNINKNFKRKPMKNFEYLKSSITPSITQYVVTIIIVLLMSIVISIFFHNEEIFKK